MNPWVDGLRGMPRILGNTFQHLQRMVWGSLPRGVLSDDLANALGTVRGWTYRAGVVRTSHHEDGS